MQIRVYLKVMGLCDDLPWHRRIAVRLVGTRAEPKEALGQMQIRVYLKVMGLCDDLPWHRRIAVQLVGTKAEPKEALSQMQHHRRGTQRNPRRNPTIFQKALSETVILSSRDSFFKNSKKGVAVEATTKCED